MKTLKRIAFTLTFFTVSLGANVNGNFSKASGISRMEVELVEEECGVSDQQIRDYMLLQGYIVLSLMETETCDKIADTQFSYHTRVLIFRGTIVGLEDIP